MSATLARREEIRNAALMAQTFVENMKAETATLLAKYNPPDAIVEALSLADEGALLLLDYVLELTE